MAVGVGLDHRPHRSWGDGASQHLDVVRHRTEVDRGVGPALRQSIAGGFDRRHATPPSPSSKQSDNTAGSDVDEVTGDHPDCRTTPARIGMDPRRGGDGVQRVTAAGQRSGDDPGEHVTRSGRRQPLVAAVDDVRRTAVGDDRRRALEQHDRTSGGSQRMC